MKKTIFILLLIATLLVICYFFIQRKENKVENFAIELVDNAIPIEQVLKKRINYSEKQKGLCLIFLKTIREEYKKNPEKIKVISASEHAKFSDKNRIKLYDGEHLFYIEFNKSLTLPFIVNKKSQIIILFYLTKGEGGNLKNSRSDD